ncbi:MAG: GNAT family N-acetyltransferase [Legionellales bacterium]|jgi:ribosomal protein S18 acetylase RimI-like enzyme
MQIIRILNSHEVSDIQWKHLVELFIEYHQFYKQNTKFSIASSYLSKRLESGQSFCLLAIDNQEVQGFIQIYPIISCYDDKSGWILYDLFVCPAARGKKIANLLLDAAKTYAIEAHVDYIQLTTAYDNNIAQACYISHGYQVDNHHAYYTLNLNERILSMQSAEVDLIVNTQDLEKCTSTIKIAHPQLNLAIVKSELLSNKLVIFVKNDEQNLPNILFATVSFCSLQMKPIWHIHMICNSETEAVPLLAKAIEYAKDINIAEINIKLNKNMSEMTKLLEKFAFKTTDQWVQYILPICNTRRCLLILSVNPLMNTA